MKKNNILFILVLLLMILGSMNDVLTYISLIMCIVLFIIVSLSSNKNNSEICICIILLLCLQNFCIGIGAHSTGNTSKNLSYITQIPFISIFIISILTRLKNKIKLDKSLIFYILYLLSISLSFFLGKGNLNSIIISIRNATVFYMAYDLAKMLIKSKKELDSFCKIYLKITIFMFVIGLILLISGETLYNMIGLKEVYIAKNVNSSTIINGLPGRFYTKLTSFLILRMGSLYYEPINLAYLFALGCIISYFYKINCKSIPKIYFCINLIGLILTVGKGGYLIVFLTFSMIYLSRFIKMLDKKIKEKNLKKITIIFIIVAVIFGLKLYIGKYTGNSAMPHIWAIQNTFNSIINKPLGHGIGMGGNMGSLYNNLKNDSEIGNESALMTIFYQFGIHGGIFFILCFINLYGKVVPKDNMQKVCEYLPIVLLFVSLFQENTVTPQCITGYMFLIGAMYNIKNRLEKKEELK